MTEDLKKKLNTAGSFDGPWLKNQLRNWDVGFEQQKADFMEHMYQIYQPGNSCYSGLWERFCLTEAGPYCRNQYFHALAAIEEFESKKETL
jgi:hypothetical protein